MVCFLNEAPPNPPYYLAGLDLETGWLVIFDQRQELPPIRDRTPGNRAIVVIRG
ncbi:hypothetical protein [Coleofasciculus sp. E1-EBD-02]|jgi:hypothetical protein|uniref:hypothetical protein n=1 Tax=Coleofasciculus sp. E1-EBD-02 TaxID=3068481 RepID=UPI0032FCE0DE